MTLPVNPPERASHQSYVVVDQDRHRPPADTMVEGHRLEAPTKVPVIGSAAAVIVDAETGAAVANLDPVDTVPLSTAISRYTSDDSGCG